MGSKKNFFRQIANISTLGLYNKVADSLNVLGKMGSQNNQSQPQQQIIDMSGKSVVEQGIKEGEDLLDLKNRRRKSLLSTILSLNKNQNNTL